MTAPAPPIFLRREPAEDPRLPPGVERYDVRAYDLDGVQLAHWSWGERPRLYRRRIDLDGQRRRVVWLPDADASEVKPSRRIFRRGVETCENRD